MICGAVTAVAQNGSVVQAFASADAEQGALPPAPPTAAVEAGGPLARGLLSKLPLGGVDPLHS